MLLDAGLIVELKPEDRRNLISLFKAVVENDGRRAAQLMAQQQQQQQQSVELSGSSSEISRSSSSPDSNNDDNAPKSSRNVSNVDIAGYEEAMERLVNTVHQHGLSLGQIGVGTLLQQVLQLSYQHNVKLESRFVSVVVAIMLAEGMGRRLDPDLDIIARAIPYIRSAATNLLL